MRPAHSIKVDPANCTIPGVTVTDDGIVVTAVFRGEKPCGLILYNMVDDEKITVAFTDQYRFGSLYSAKITNLDPSAWCYRFYCGDTCFPDPCSRSLVEHVSEGERFIAGGFFYDPDDRLPPCRCTKLRRAGDEVIYSLHIRGFTMLCEGLKSCPGTFSAAAERAGYLQQLGVTAVELMPVYELQPQTRAENGPRTMEDALALYPVGRDGLPVKDLSVVRTNYWGYGRGFYYAPKAELSTPGYAGGAQKEFADMVECFHSFGISVYLQLYFTASVTSQQQIGIARYYVTHYAVDGFRLMGPVADIRAFSTDPLLSDVRLFHTEFPYGDIEGMDAENPESGAISTEHLSNYNPRFSQLIRRFCKSDDYVMREFLYEFLKVPSGHGSVRYVCSSDGFTLRDLVSYSEKHNEPNGEGGIDGPDENFSWNCGAEGESAQDDINRLRRNQIRNFLTLVLLSQGTPLINAGDEAFNTQYGNNNPYCQDNETGWIGWDNGKTGDGIRTLVRRLIAFRNEHPVFRGIKPFKNMDYIACGYPDLSLHGNEAWKPDLGHFSHAIGICLCENYVRSSEKTELIYLAVNMHWEKQELGLPKLAPGRRWNLLADTSLEETFLTGECVLEDQHVVETAPRSIRILNTVTSNKPIRRRRAKSKQKTETAERKELTAEVSTGTAGSDKSIQSGKPDQEGSNEKD